VCFGVSSKVAITVVYKGDKKDEVLGVAAPPLDYWGVGARLAKDNW
jgi:hypothetical protein